MSNLDELKYHAKKILALCCRLTLKFSFGNSSRLSAIKMMLRLGAHYAG